MKQAIFRSFLFTSLVLLALPVLRAHADTDPTLVGYWKFNEGSGSTVHDETTNNNNGTLVGGVSFSTAHIAPISAANPSSLFFDGSSGTGVHVLDNNSLDMTTAMTAMAWIYWDGTGGDNVVFDKSDHDGGDTPNYRLILGGDGHIKLWNGSAAASSAGVVSPNQWTLVNFTITTSTTKFYINGQASGTANIGLGAVTNYDLLIGRDAIGRYFHGYIDEARLYSRELTPSEIDGISQGGAGPGGGSTITNHHAHYSPVTVTTYGPVSNPSSVSPVVTATVSTTSPTTTPPATPLIPVAVPAQPPIAPPAAVPLFTKDLFLVVVDPQVKLLQQYLNTHGYALASSGPGSPGNETSRYGGLTKIAVAKLQVAHGILPTVGYFGILTRNFVNSHL